MDKYAELRAALEDVQLHSIHIPVEPSPSSRVLSIHPARIRALLEDRDALRGALKVANDALEEISNEMTVGDRWTNAGQSLLDSLPVARAALAQEQGEKHDNQD